MKLYFLPFFATVISVAESSLRANVFADEAERELGQLDDRPAVLASDADEGEGRRLCDRKCRRKKRRERRNKGDDDDDDDDKDGGDSSGGKRLQLYCGECVHICVCLFAFYMVFTCSELSSCFPRQSAVSLYSALSMQYGNAFVPPDAMSFFA